MKMLSKRQVKELVLYSPQHIARLEAAGEFPKRVKLGNNRVMNYLFEYRPSKFKSRAVLTNLRLEEIRWRGPNIVYGRTPVIGQYGNGIRLCVHSTLQIMDVPRLLTRVEVFCRHFTKQIL